MMAVKIRHVMFALSIIPQSIPSQNHLYSVPVFTGQAHQTCTRSVENRMRYITYRYSAVT